MKKDENKVEKIDEKEAENVSGGYYGKDHNKEDAIIYKELGITHNRHALKKDTYYIGETKIPANLAYTLKGLYICPRVNVRSVALDLVSRIKDGDVSEEEFEPLAKSYADYYISPNNFR